MVYAADGQSIDMEYIYEFFNNRYTVVVVVLQVPLLVQPRNCPNLMGKPKFFIVQVCWWSLLTSANIQTEHS